MKKILISLMAIALVIGLAGAGTLAYFSDTETSTGNSFTAGTLDIALGTSSWSTGFDNMKPGDTVTFTLPVNNGGSLPLDYVVTTELGGVLGTSGAVTATVTPDSGSLDVGVTVNLVVTVTFINTDGDQNYLQGATGTLDVTVQAYQQ